MNSIEIKKRRQFFAIIILALVASGTWKATHHLVQPGSRLIAAALALALIELTAPQAAALLFKGWIKFAHLLGVVNTYVLITLVYFVVITPLGVCIRLLSKASPLSEGEYKKRKSSWNPLPPVPAGADSYRNSY